MDRPCGLLSPSQRDTGLKTIKGAIRGFHVPLAQYIGLGTPILPCGIMVNLINSMVYCHGHNPKALAPERAVVLWSHHHAGANGIEFDVALTGQHVFFSLREA